MAFGFAKGIGPIARRIRPAYLGWVLFSRSGRPRDGSACAGRDRSSVYQTNPSFPLESGCRLAEVAYCSARSREARWGRWHAFEQPDQVNQRRRDHDDQGHQGEQVRLSPDSTRCGWQGRQPLWTSGGGPPSESLLLRAQARKADLLPATLERITYRGIYQDYRLRLDDGQGFQRH